MKLKLNSCLSILLLIVSVGVAENYGWESLLKQVPPANLVQPLPWQELDERIRDTGSKAAKVEVIGTIKKPDDLLQKLTAIYRDRTDLKERIEQLPSELPVRIFHFKGSRNPKDPTLLIIGGEHGNERSSPNVALWMAELLGRESDLAFLSQTFYKIALIPVYNPYGCALGIRRGVNGVDPVFLNPFFSTETRERFLQTLPAESRERFGVIGVQGASTEEKIFRKFLVGFSKDAIILTFHEKDLNGKSALTATYYEPEALRRIGKGWSEAMEACGFIKDAENKYPPTTAFSEGFFVARPLTPQSVGASFKFYITIEVGSKSFERRMVEHHAAAIGVLKGIIELHQKGKL